ncbi:hypothetical protein AeRB84_013895, partial [Aphanomyces euteiches]
CTAGHFLPDVGEAAFDNPDHVISVNHFRSETTRFWESCGEEVWKRMFQLTDKADGKAWERIVYQATHLVVELQILIDHSDFDDDLITVVSQADRAERYRRARVDGGSHRIFVV